ncbi:MAG: LacI family DNA-binding transcriptional regulator [Salinibacter sp.]
MENNERVTISDVAEQAGVSTGTVSAVLNGKSSVRKETRDRVEETIEELKYRPSPSARNLGSSRAGKRGKSEKIGVILKEIGNPFYTDLILGVRDFMNDEGYDVFVSTSEGGYKKEKDVIGAFQDRDLDGVIVAPILKKDADISHLFSLRENEYPFVLLEDVRGLRASVVSIDNVRAAELAVRYLIDHGHERIVHFSGPRYSKHTRDRVRGVRKAFSESNIQFTEDVIISTGARMEDGYQKAKTLFEDQSENGFPTAVTCFNDLVAMGVMRAIEEAGLDVPGDVSVIGCDDIQPAQYLSVPLTTVQAPKRKMGQVAAKLLLRQIESDESVDPKQVVLESELVVRDSTEPIADQ